MNELLKEKLRVDELIDKKEQLKRLKELQDRAEQRYMELVTLDFLINQLSRNEQIEFWELKRDLFSSKDAIDKLQELYEIYI